jgi:predicted amidohydrolase
LALLNTPTIFAIIPLRFCKAEESRRFTASVSFQTTAFFDEKRYFSAGSETVVVKINDTTVVCTICEDVWELRWLGEFLATVPEKNLLVNISASPFHAGKITSENQCFAGLR